MPETNSRNALDTYAPEVVAQRGDFRLIRQYRERYPHKGADFTLERNSKDAMGGDCWGRLCCWFVEPEAEPKKDELVPFRMALLLLGTDLPTTRRR